MLEQLRDPVWQFIGAILALGAIAISVWIYFAQRTSKRLLIERVARVPLVTMGPDAIPGLAVTLNGVPVTEASVVVVHIENMGNAPLPASDYEHPITLSFEERAEVVDASLVSAEPDSIPVKLECDGNSLRVVPMLLNPGDSFVCRALVKGSTGRYTALARIAGVRSLESTRPVPISKSLVAAACLILLTGAFVLTPSPMSVRLFEMRRDELPYAIVIALSFVTLLATTFYDLGGRVKKLKRRIRMQMGHFQGD